MKYLNVEKIANEFDKIERIEVNHRGFEVIVHGVKNKKYYRYREKFLDRFIGMDFADKISKFK